MIRLLTALLGLNRVAPDEARRIHARFAGIILTTIFLIIVVGLGSNLAGYKVVNLILSPIFTLATVLFWTRPSNLAIVAGTGAIAGTALEGVSKTAKKFFKLYFLAVGHLWLWGSIIFLFLGTIPAKENPLAVFGILSACAVIGLASTIWKMGAAFYKKFIYKYAVVMLVLFALALVPRYAWIKLTGYDIKGAVVPSETEAAISEIEKAEITMEESKNLAILTPILEKIEDGKPLMEWERKFLEEMKERRHANSLPGAIQRAIDSIGSTGAVPIPAQYEYAPTPAPAPAQYVAPAPQPEPPAAKSVLVGKWNFQWTGANVSARILTDNPLKATSKFDDKVMIFTESSRSDDGTIVGKWECTGQDWHQWGTFSIKFHGDVAAGALDSALEKSSLVGKKIS